MELEYQIEGEIEYLVGDAGRLRQILVNLVGNAVKFTQRGEVFISARSENLPNHEVELSFSVADSGIGIPLDKQGSIFGAFTQVDGSTTRIYGGTGLGLAISSKLVALMGGKIWLESAVGKGSTFHFTIRMRAQEQPLPSATDHISALRNVPILVVSNSRSSSRVVFELCKGWGMRPSLAGSRDAATIALNQAYEYGREFRVTIIDGRLPDCDGLELAAGIRKDYGQTALVTLLTSDMMASNIPDVAAYLRKPVKRSDLFRSLLAALGHPIDATKTAETHRPHKSSKSLRVLVAEDNPVNQGMVVGMLRKMGHSTKVAMKGQDVLSLWSEEAFDLILMDVQMPLMDAITTTRKIRERESHSGSHVPIIAMTAHATKEYEQRCLAAGMDAYLAKPMNGQQLEGAIARICVESSACEQSPSPFVAFNPEKVRIRLGGDEDLMKEIIGVFIEQYPKQVASLRQAIQEENWEIVERTAHTMKGELGCFELDKASQWARELEDIGKNRTLERASAILAALENEVSIIVSEMHRCTLATDSQS